MPNQNPVSTYLHQHNIPHQLFQHTEPVGSLEEAATARQQQPDQIVRSILFRVAKDSYMMVLITGVRQISWRTLRSYLAQSRLTLASKEQVQTVTGYQIGAVSPFGLPQPLRILIDETVMAQSEISIGSGVRGSAIIMKTNDLRRALPEAEIGAFSQQIDSQI